LYIAKSFFICIFAPSNKVNMNYVAYYRTSTQRQSLGIVAQRNAVCNFINSDEANILISEYQEKESGKCNHRKELNNAINECKQKNATLVISKLDRLSRNISFIFQLKDSGVNFLALDVPNFNTLTLGIFASLAQSERELISQRTKDALRAKKLQGVVLGAPNAHFTSEQIRSASIARKQIALDNENNMRAKIMIEALLANTTNCSQIARILNDNGFRTSKNSLFDCKAVKRLIERYNLN
jgi:DNA invertase Pin-like site-specific DNA recombinase